MAHLSTEVWKEACPAFILAPTISTPSWQLRGTGGRAYPQRAQPAFQCLAYGLGNADSTESSLVSLGTESKDGEGSLLL